MQTCPRAWGQFDRIHHNKDEGLEMGCILGLWKPRNEKQPVSDTPLIVCDPRTVDFATEAVPQEQDFVGFELGGS